MSNEVAVRNDTNLMADVILHGDLNRFSPEKKVEYYARFCESLGLNPLTQPFQYIVLNGKERLYATKDATEQLRKIHGVSVSEITRDELNGVCIVTAKGHDKNGRTDAATGAVNIQGLRGDALANALMKAETKAKRRLTLSICGLGMLDETELETIDQRSVKEAVVDNHMQGSMETGREKINELLERYAAVLHDSVLDAARMDMEAAKTVEDLREVYLSLKRQGETVEKEEQKDREQRTLDALKHKPTELADEAEPVLPDGEDEGPGLF